MEHGSISTEQCSISTEQGSIFTYQGSILCRRVPFQWVRVPFLWRRIPLIWRRFHFTGVWFHVYRATTRYYHQQPPRGTFCSPRAHTFLFHTRKKNSASRNFFKLTKKKSLKNEQLGQKCAWMFGMGRLVDGRNL